MTRPLSLALSLIVSCLLFGSTCDASSYKNVDTASPQEIVDGMATKGVRGAVNILTGWGEIPKQIYVTSVESGWLRGTIIGPLKGLGMTVVRTVSGAGELLTFFIAYPGFYDPWIEPRFVWMKESSDRESPF
jgi:putative exosortase-associated protein (TIGR04073 family)